MIVRSCVATARPDDVDRVAADLDPVPELGAFDRHPVFRRLFDEPPRCGGFVRIECGPDPGDGNPLHDSGQTCHMILVNVGGHREVDPIDPKPGETRAESGGIGPTVDEDGESRQPNDDRVALTDIEHDETGIGTGAGGQDHDGHHRDHDAQHPQAMDSPPDQADPHRDRESNGIQLWPRSRYAGHEDESLGEQLGDTDHPVDAESRADTGQGGRHCDERNRDEVRERREQRDCPEHCEDHWRHGRLRRQGGDEQRQHPPPVGLQSRPHDESCGRQDRQLKSHRVRHPGCHQH